MSKDLRLARTGDPSGLTADTDAGDSESAVVSFAPGYTLTIADRHEVSEAQQLRHDVFAAEFGTHMSTLVGGLDADEFDAHADHLIVRENSSRKIVGTYRMMSPRCATLVGERFGDRTFDLGALRPIAADLVETGRSCVHPDHRNGAVINLIWSGIGQYMRRTGHRWLGGCAWVHLRGDEGPPAFTWNAIRTKYTAPAEFRVTAHQPLLSDDTADVDGLVMPPLLRGYLRLGSWVCGEPAYDPDARVASFYVLLSLDHMNPRYRRHFFE
ncbi:GNAT family N-acetyltransferase [Streptomyces sp. NPDC087844]|uniref:GNAT family N-acetyltransferase n=1 Tax=Streptomyces sp. NPDC087844 TaxID=3365805 RepID=UPI0038020F23